MALRQLHRRCQNLSRPSTHKKGPPKRAFFMLKPMATQQQGTGAPELTQSAMFNALMAVL